MNPRPPTRPAVRGVLLGILRLARFDAGGLAQFGDTRAAFLGSLAPWIAFPLVGCTLMLLDGEGLHALADFFAILCALLVPAVLSHALAVAWDREADWLRYATAFNWTQWAVPIIAAALLLVLLALVRLGMPNGVAALLDVVGLVGYGLGLHWFVARHGLRLSVLRAGVLAVGINLGTAALLVGLPRLLAWATGTPLQAL
ncbi:MAG: hypothetical protein JO264_07175 [Acidisphaera sp.]|nr:hypothetical protein [Acidisphaera sp.]